MLAILLRVYYIVSKLIIRVKDVVEEHLRRAEGTLVFDLVAVLFRYSGKSKKRCPVVIINHRDHRMVSNEQTNHFRLSCREVISKNEKWRLKFLRNLT